MIRHRNDVVDRRVAEKRLCPSSAGRPGPARLYATRRIAMRKPSARAAETTASLMIVRWTYGVPSGW